MEKERAERRKKKGGLHEVAYVVLDNCGGEETWFRVSVGINSAESADGFAPKEKTPLSIPG